LPEARTKAAFRAMTESTKEDWDIVREAEAIQFKALPGIVLGELEKLKEETEAFAVSRYEHSLQSATLAYRDGADEEMIVAALLHDIGDTLALHNHAEIAAAVLKPYVSRKTHWIIKHHGIFQGVYFWHHVGLDPNSRDKYRDHEWFDDAAAFCEKYDQNAFDPDYDSLPVEFFTPMVKRIFSRKPYSAL
jgi:predicted HD phosphohydrolase